MSHQTWRPVPGIGGADTTSPEQSRYFIYLFIIKDCYTLAYNGRFTYKTLFPDLVNGYNLWSVSYNLLCYSTVWKGGEADWRLLVVPPTIEYIVQVRCRNNESQSEWPWRTLCGLCTVWARRRVTAHTYTQHVLLQGAAIHEGEFPLGRTNLWAPYKLRIV